MFGACSVPSIVYKNSWTNAYSSPTRTLQKTIKRSLDSQSGVHRIQKLPHSIANCSDVKLKNTCRYHGKQTYPTMTKWRSLGSDETHIVSAFAISTKVWETVSSIEHGSQNNA
mmetsp:Transcript_50660/g.162101  ORF Transcript_50660/g.162101 Transcript_50660/m.162101 type:complete len:113 (-) Transcript_50660:59-397(-)